MDPPKGLSEGTTQNSAHRLKTKFGIQIGAAREKKAEAPKVEKAAPASE